MVEIAVHVLLQLRVFSQPFWCRQLQQRRLLCHEFLRAYYLAEHVLLLQCVVRDLVRCRRQLQRQLRRQQFLRANYRRTHLCITIIRLSM